MSVVLTINGNSYDYPAVPDQDGWGPDATDWAVAVTNGMLQKAGGLFQLLSETDFGTAFGLKSLYYKSRTTNPASTGALRLGVTDGIYWRNNANDGNLGLTIDGSDNLLYDGNLFGGILGVTDTNSVDLTIAANAVSADLNLSAAAASAANQLVTLSIESDGLKAQITDARIISAIPNATSLVTGLLTSADWTTFNSKQAALTFTDTSSIDFSVIANVVTAILKLSVSAADAGYINAASTLEADGLQVQVPILVGDSGAGGTAGVVPAPSSGDAAANKFLKASGLWAVPSSLILKSAQTGASYTTVLADAFKVVTLSNATECIVTIPTNASVAYDIGTYMYFTQSGAGSMVISPAGGVTIHSLSGFNRLNGEYAEAFMIKIDTNEWYLFGQLKSQYIVATGGTITTDGNFKIHKFTSSGDFVITDGQGTIESLVVAGGGGGGNAAGGGVTGGGGGGGAGGLINTTPGNTYTAGTFPVVIGAGGTGGNNGSNSSFDLYTSTGGGSGALTAAVSHNGNNGGSGGGGDQSGNGGLGSGTQGNNGGNGNLAGSFNAGGGGGGHGGGAANATPDVGGNGGLGTSVSITGAAVFYASGGGGGCAGGTAGTASAGGGGNGSNSGNGSNATANTGGGGGGCGAVSATGGTGGSGVVILRYRYQ